MKRIIFYMLFIVVAFLLIAEEAVAYQDNFAAVIKCDGIILREQDKTVKLPFDSEYSILLKNLDSRRALVRIEIDGDNAFHDILL